MPDVLINSPSTDVAIKYDATPSGASAHGRGRSGMVQVDFARGVSMVTVFGVGSPASSVSLVLPNETALRELRVTHEPSGPAFLSDLALLAWVTGDGIRNKEMNVPFSDED
jgi:hypothetical protein